MIKHELIVPRMDTGENDTMVATLRHVYGALDCDTIEFYLMDSSAYTLNKCELFTAMQVITSEEFSALCVALNQREETNELVNDLYCKAVDNQNTDIIYDIYHQSKMLGRYQERAYQLRENIISRVSWHSWVAATRLYETLFHISREWLG